MRYAAAMAAVLAWATLGVAQAGSVDLPLQIGGAYSVPTPSIQETRYRATTRQKYDFSCGSAALSTLLTYQYRFPVDEQAVFEEMYRHGDQARIQQAGFSLLDMKRYLEAHGFTADGFEAPLDKLEEAGIPAIVLINESGYNHFVVVKGLRDGRVLVGDPAGGTRALRRSDFEALWVNHILFVVTNRQDMAQFNRASDWHAAPKAPLEDGINRDGLSSIVLPKLGPGDF